MRESRPTHAVRIDRIARDGAIRAIRAVQRFRDLETTNNVFGDEFPGSRIDAGVRAISGALWFFYDDISEHKLDGAHALTPANVTAFNRCIMFLATDIEYVSAPGPICRMVAAVAGKKLLEGTSKGSIVWPFATWEAYEEAIEDLGLAGARERGVEVEYVGAKAEIDEWRRG